MITNFLKFRFADFFDIILIIIGTITAILSGVLYQLLFLFYGKVAGVLVDYSKYRNANFNLTALSAPVDQSVGGW